MTGSKTSRPRRKRRRTYTPDFRRETAPYVRERHALGASFVRPLANQRLQPTKAQRPGIDSE